MTTEIMLREEIDKAIEEAEDVSEFFTYVEREDRGGGRLELLIPPWAKGIILKEDYEDLPVGTQLITRHPWSMGNARIIEVSLDKSFEGNLYTVMTDMGGIFKMSPKEVKSSFEVGYYLMNWEERKFQ